MRAPSHPRAEDVDLPRVLHALSDPARLAIVRRLAGEGALTCGALNGDRPKSSMSHHYRVLREAGVIRTRVEGAVHINELRTGELEDRFPGLLDVVLRG